MKKALLNNQCLRTWNAYKLHTVFWFNRRPVQVIDFPHRIVSFFLGN